MHPITTVVVAQLRRLGLAGISFLCALSFAQVPEASFQGRVSNIRGEPVPAAELRLTDAGTGFSLRTSTDPRGNFHFVSVPRGVYRVTASSAGYRSFEKQGIELAVGAKREEDFILTPLGSGNDPIADILQLVPPLPALPVETVASSVSVVIEEDEILQLPLESRNVYALFLLQPGVTAPGATLRRGLSFSVHGQRVSGSNYLLDGVDNNDIFLTGPAAASSAEAVQELRMVNSSFSAADGRATAFLAQVVTRSGTNSFHGTAFEFLCNDKLNANSFQNNTNGRSRDSLRRNQFGFSAGGPVSRNRTFFSSSMELSRLRSQADALVYVPSAAFVSSLPEQSPAGKLFAEIPPLPSLPGGADPSIGRALQILRGRMDSLYATERLDHHFGNGDRLLFRYSLSSSEVFGNELTSPGYPTLQPTDDFRSHNAVVGWLHSFSARTVNDFRVGWNRQRVQLPRPRPDIPILQAPSQPAWLPGNKRQVDWRENNNTIQFVDVFSMRRGRSAISMGFDFRRNFSNGVRLGLETDALGATAYFPNGIFSYTSLQTFGAGEPQGIGISVDRFATGPLRLSDLRREYRSNDYAGFLQDDAKLSRRLSLNMGLRYEFFGVIHDVDPSRDANFYFGDGASIEQRLATGVLRRTDQNPADLNNRLYRPDRLNFAPAIGLAWDATGYGRTILRAGYSIALDRIFDTARDLRSNSQRVASCHEAACPKGTFGPGGTLLPFLDASGPAPVVQLDANLRTPYAQNWYFGVQHTLSSNILLEVGHAGSTGRKLISRDTINRSGSEVPGTINPNIADDTFISNAGNSNYLALQTALRRQFKKGLQFQVSYTYSHTIDNQSDVLEGVRVGPGIFSEASFTRQFDARVDRGNANFDQRHNLIVNALWEVPGPGIRGTWPRALLGGWMMSGIAGRRSGFPLTVIGSLNSNLQTGLRNNRADYTGMPARLSPAPAVAGGVQWINSSAFREAADHAGNLGRGAIQGPGYWGCDFALLRNFLVRENGLRVQFRAEFYNLFNHSNLSIPYTEMGDSLFGQAFYGLNPNFSRFGELPLGSPARRVQFGLRIRF
jgi:hypothetical protein